MTHFYSQKTLVLLAILLTSIGLRAANYDFKNNGIYYKISGATVGVTAGDTKYSGTVTIPATVTNNGTTYTVTSIANSCFYDCTSLEEVKLGANITAIGYRAFYGCSNLTSINLNDKIKTLSEQAFSGCTSLKSVTLGANLTEMGSGVFNGCTALRTVDIHEGCEIIAQGAFYGCNKLQSVNIPNSVQSVGGSAFSDCTALTTATIGDGIKSIAGNCFYGCTSLEEVKLGANINSIGYRAFYGCSNLTSIYSKMKTPCTLDNSNTQAFPKLSQCTVYVPAGTRQSYIDAGWKEGEIFKAVVDFDDREEQSMGLVSLPNMTYGDKAYTLPSTTNEGLTLKWTSSNTKVATISGTRLTVKGAGKTAITAKQEDGNDTYKPFNKEFTLTVTKAALTVTAKDYTIKQGEVLPTFGASYAGFKNGETESVLTQKPTFTCSATSASAPGTYDITVSNAVAQNYDISYGKGTLTIVKADGVVVTAKNYTRKYGEANPTFGYTSEGKALDGTPEISCEATVTSPVGIYPIVVGKGSIKNSNVSYVNGTMTITKASLTIKAKNYTIQQGEALPTFDASYTGFKNGETKSVLTKQPTFVCSATSASAPGTYDIIVRGAEAKNYDITYTKGSLTIEESSVGPVITDGNCIDGIYYKFYSGDMTAEVISGEDKYTGDIVIPRSVKYNNTTYAVTAIGEEAFYYCDGLNSVTIPRSITFIDDRAFHGCGDLTSLMVESGNPIYDSREGCNAIIETASNTLIVGGRTSFIPDGISSIGGGAFSYNKGLTSISIPESVTSIGWTAFEETGLTSVTIPESVTSIGSYAFTGTDIASVIIPKSVTSIGQGAFSNCQKLTSVQVEKDNPVYDSRNNCNAIIETASNTLIEGWEFSSIPNDITSLGDAAFIYCFNMESIKIPNSVTSIASTAFWGCGLKSVTIPKSVTSIGTHAFYCTSLHDMYCYAVTPPKSEGDIFFDVNLKRVILHVPAESIDAYKAKEPWKSFGNIIAIEKMVIAGDANGDGGVNVFDVTATVNYILGSPNDGFDFEAADVNGDGTVNVFDVTKLVNIILGVDVAEVKMRKVEGQNGTDKLYFENFEIEPGETKVVNVLLDNPNAEYRDLQFDLYLPEGITVVQDEDDEFLVDTGSRCTKKHTIGFSYTDGHYVCMLYSTAKNPLTGNSGDILSITLKADENVATGAQKGYFRNVSLSKTDATGPTYDELSFDITVKGDVDGISDVVVNDGPYQIYTIDGEQVENLHQGVNIIRYSDGTTKKVYVK